MSCFFVKKKNVKRHTTKRIVNIPFNDGSVNIEKMVQKEFPQLKKYNFFRCKSQFVNGKSKTYKLELVDVPSTVNFNELKR